MPCCSARFPGRVRFGPCHAFRAQQIFSFPSPTGRRCPSFPSPLGRRCPSFPSPLGRRCPEGAAENSSCNFGISAIHGGQMSVGSLSPSLRTRPSPLPLSRRERGSKLELSLEPGLHPLQD